MQKLKVMVTLQNVSTKETTEMVLPCEDFTNQYNLFTHNGSNIVSVVKVCANFDFCNSNINVQALNKLLMGINSLNDVHFQKTMDLYSIEEHSHLGLLIAFTNEKHYEVIDEETAVCNDFNELKRRAGALYMLGVWPDVMISLDGIGLITDEDREAFFREGIRSKGIILINDKFYVKDKYLLESAMDTDIEYYEAEERLYEKNKQ